MGQWPSAAKITSCIWEVCSSFTIQKKAFKHTDVHVRQLLHTCFPNYRTLPISETKNLILYLFFSQFEMIKKDAYPLCRWSIAVKLLNVNHPNVYYLIRTIYTFQSKHIKYYINKIISWQHISTLLSHHQVLHRTIELVQSISYITMHSGIPECIVILVGVVE